MTKYRIHFVYGSWNFHADIERERIPEHDRRGFANLATLAVNIALESHPEPKGSHQAHTINIYELTEGEEGGEVPRLVYAFDSLRNEH